MTRFMEKSFTVGTGNSKNYVDNFDRIFGKKENRVVFGHENEDGKWVDDVIDFADLEAAAPFPAEEAPTLADLVRDGKMAHFRFYIDGVLWYETEDGFKFPVPTNDCGNGFFNAEDKAILFMRWIRKHLEFIARAKKEQDVLREKNSTPEPEPT